MSNYKAIPTKHNGVQYRSRLEARWAMFFDYLGIEYYYEYEGFQLPSGWYLPDFYLPEHGWFEIKPVPPNKREVNVITDLSIHLKQKSSWFDKVFEQRFNLETFDNTLQSYILVGFPLRHIYDPMSYLTGSDPEGRTCLIEDNTGWYEDFKKTDEVTFIRNSHWEKYLCGEPQTVLGIFWADKACPFCYQQTSICKELESFKRLTLEHYDHTLEFIREAQLLNRGNYLDDEVVRDFERFENQCINVYKKIRDEHEQVQKQCSYRNSKRINDAYQMASKHRFY